MSKYLILTGDSDFNLGDAAILASTVEALCEADPKAEITVTGAAPLMGRLPNIQRVIAPGWAGLRELLAAARDAHRVIVAGGGLFQDDDSRAKVPYWALKLALLRLFNNNIVGHSIGAGPLQRPGTSQFAYLASLCFRSISVRDEYARAELQPCSRRTIELTADPAFMLRPASSAEGAHVIEKTGLDPRAPLIAVALRGWFHERGGLVPRRVRVRLGLRERRDEDKLQHFVDSFATVLRRLAGELGASVLLIPSYRTVLEGDVAVCREIAQYLRPETPSGLAVLDDPAVYKSVVGHCKLIISARMHPLIFAAGMGVPGVGLTYNGKFEGMYRQLGVEPRLVSLDQAFDPAAVDRIEALAHEALADRTDLRHRASLLAERARFTLRQLVQEPGLLLAHE